MKDEKETSNGEIRRVVAICENCGGMQAAIAEKEAKAKMWSRKYVESCKGIDKLEALIALGNKYVLPGEIDSGDSALMVIKDQAKIIAEKDAIIKKALEVIKISSCGDVYIGKFSCKVAALKKIRTEARQFINSPEIKSYLEEKEYLKGKEWR